MWQATTVAEETRCCSQSQFLNDKATSRCQIERRNSTRPRAAKQGGQESRQYSGHSSREGTLFKELPSLTPHHRVQTTTMFSFILKKGERKYFPSFSHTFNDSFGNEEHGEKATKASEGKREDSQSREEDSPRRSAASPLNVEGSRVLPPVLLTRTTTISEGKSHILLRLSSYNIYNHFHHSLIVTTDPFERHVSSIQRMLRALCVSQRTRRGHQATTAIVLVIVAIRKTLRYYAYRGQQ